MGLIGGMGSYLIFRSSALFSLPVPGISIGFSPGFLVSVVLASLACALELGLSGTSPFSLVIPSMLIFHALIGIGEAFITTAILSAVLAARSDLIRTWKAGETMIKTV